MTARDIQEALRADLFAGNPLVCPNYTPNHWFECDMFSVSKAGYWTEHEIKISVADFKADTKKERRYFDWAAWHADGGPRSKEIKKKYDRVDHKHTMLANKDPKGPSYFWYVVPEGLLTAADVPEWAGLKVVSLGKTWRSIEIVKPAPRRHLVKCSQSVLDHVRGIFYWRYWRLRRTLTPAQLLEIEQEDARADSLLPDQADTTSDPIPLQR